MEPLEPEGRRNRKPRDGNGGHRPGARESLLLTSPGTRTGGRHPGRGTASHAPVRQRYPNAPAPQWPAARPPGEYGNDGARPGRDEPTAREYPPRHPGPGNGDSVSVAARILSVADYEAASITQQASLQAAMVTRRVANEASEIREAANREAEEIRQQASLQAAAVREEAEIQAAEAHAAVMSMQTELGELAERIRTTLPRPALPPIAPPGRPAVGPATGPQARPATGPQARPATGPQARVTTGPQARPATGPRARPATGPQARPATGPQARTHAAPSHRAAAKPGARSGGKAPARPAAKPAGGSGRQAGAIRFAVAAVSATFLVAVVAGATEIHLHGFDFFIFRAVATGETGPNGLQEDQGPGQPDAPKPTPTSVPRHITVKPSPHSTVTAHNNP